MALLQLPPAALDSVLAFLDGAQLIRFGGASRRALDCVRERLDYLARGEWRSPQGWSVTAALSQSVVLALSAQATENAHNERLALPTTAPLGPWTGRLRPQPAWRDPRANLLVEHRRLLGGPLYGRLAWEAAELMLGRPPIDEHSWWARPGLRDQVALAIMDAHCAFCASRLRVDEAEDVIYEQGQRVVRQVCGFCNRAQVPHYTRWLKNNCTRNARYAKRVWFFCNQDNPECFNWHHGTQDRCECLCHGARHEVWGDDR